MHFKIRELPFYSKSLEVLTNFIITNIITNMDWITLPVKPIFPPLSLLLLFGCAGSLLQCRGSSLLREGFSLVAVSKGYSLVVMCGLLVAVGSVVAEHGPSEPPGTSSRTHRLQYCAAWAQILHGMWDPPGPGIKPVSPGSGLPTPGPPGQSH